MINPRDFAPFRTEIELCQCDLCYPMGYANRPYAQRVADATALLTALRAGTHKRMSLAERAEIARREHRARVAAACADGVTERRMAILIRGYATGRDSDVWPYGPAGPMQAAEFVDGIGIGMTPGRHATAEAARRVRVERAERDRARTVARLIATDGRNRCTYFRFRGELCDHHATHGTAPTPAPSSAPSSAPHVSDWTADTLTTTPSDPMPVPA